MGPAVLITHQPWVLVQLVWQTLKTTDLAPKTTAVRFKTHKNILPGQLKSVSYLYIFLTINYNKKIQSQMSVTVSLFHIYTNTVSTMVELRMARLNSLIRGLLGRLWRERKKNRRSIFLCSNTFKTFLTVSSHRFPGDPVESWNV